MDQQQIFRSAVSGEFETAREKLGRTLTGIAIPVREQINVSADPDGLTLLGKLHNSVSDFGCVVSLIGTRKPPRPRTDFSHGNAASRSAAVTLHDQEILTTGPACATNSPIV